MRIFAVRTRVTYGARVNQRAVDPGTAAAAIRFRRNANNGVGGPCSCLGLKIALVNHRRIDLATAAAAVIMHYECAPRWARNAEIADATRAQLDWFSFPERRYRRYNNYYNTVRFINNELIFINTVCIRYIIINANRYLYRMLDDTLTK